MFVEDKQVVFSGTFNSATDFKPTYRHVRTYTLIRSRPTFPFKGSIKYEVIKSVSGPYRHIYTTNKKKQHQLSLTQTLLRVQLMGQNHYVNSYVMVCNMFCTNDSLTGTGTGRCHRQTVCERRAQRPIAHNAVLYSDRTAD